MVLRMRRGERRHRRTGDDSVGRVEDALADAVYAQVWTWRCSCHGARCRCSRGSAGPSTRRRSTCVAERTICGCLLGYLRDGASGLAAHCLFASVGRCGPDLFRWEQPLRLLFVAEYRHGGRSRPIVDVGRTGVGLPQLRSADRVAQRVAIDRGAPPPGRGQQCARGVAAAAQGRSHAAHVPKRTQGTHQPLTALAHMTRNGRSCHFGRALWRLPRVEP
mmetsp:Transcript_133174/g.385288  ORF Transcript_133174/g.385288 Transcript_133174/m.385288 type:complete len:219 (-) Transcript_133174:229-885(-)